MITQPINKPNRHPWDVRFSSCAERRRMHRFLMMRIMEGLAANGARFQDLRKGAPITRQGYHNVMLDEREWCLRLWDYNGLRWLWRITIPQHPEGHLPMLRRELELTLLDSEATQELGMALADMLRAQGRGEQSVWPLFDHWPSFPGYCWSQASRARYDDWLHAGMRRDEESKLKHAQRVAASRSRQVVADTATATGAVAQP